MARLKRNPKDLRVSPIVREFFEIVYDKNVDVTRLGDRAGVSRETILRWQTTASPNLNTFIACLNAVGCDLEIKR